MSRILLYNGEAVLRVGFATGTARNPGGSCTCHQEQHLKSFGDAFRSSAIRTGAKYGRGRSLYRQMPMLGVRGMND